MGTVTVLPINARPLNAVRTEVSLIAKRYGADDRKRRKAFMHALRLIEEGSSTAWAIQAARQDLREPTRVQMCGRPFGGDAA